MLRPNRKDCFKYFPRILLQLLVSKAHSAVFLIQFENNYLDRITYTAEFRRMLDFLGPAEVRNVDQTVNSFFKFDEQAEVGEVANCSLLLRLQRISLINFSPWVLFQLLEPK